MYPCNPRKVRFFWLKTPEHFYRGNSPSGKLVQEYPVNGNYHPASVYRKVLLIQASTFMSLDSPSINKIPIRVLSTSMKFDDREPTFNQDGCQNVVLARSKPHKRVMQWHQNILYYPDADSSFFHGDAPWKILLNLLEKHSLDSSNFIQCHLEILHFRIRDMPLAEAVARLPVRTLYGHVYVETGIAGPNFVRVDKISGGGRQRAPTSTAPRWAFRGLGRQEPS